MTPVLASSQQQDRKELKSHDHVLLQPFSHQSQGWLHDSQNSFQAASELMCMERPQQMGKLFRRQHRAGRADPEQGSGHLCTSCGAQQPWQQLCQQLPQEPGRQPAQNRLTGLLSHSKLWWHPLSDRSGLNPTLGTRRSAGSQLAWAGPQAMSKACCRVTWAQQGIPSPHQAHTLLQLMGQTRGFGLSLQEPPSTDTAPKVALKHSQGSCRLTCLVATSERFRRVHRQFWTSLGLELVRCLPNACMPPAGKGTVL